MAAGRGCLISLARTFTKSLPRSSCFVLLLITRVHSAKFKLTSIFNLIARRPATQRERLTSAIPEPYEIEAQALVCLVDFSQACSRGKRLDHLRRRKPRERDEVTTGGRQFRRDLQNFTFPTSQFTRYASAQSHDFLAGTEISFF